MLSLKDIRKILDTGKPVVWTMHDIWPATAICHYNRGCEQYQSQCKKCPLLPSGRLVQKIWNRKKQMLDGHRVTYVCCSEWLANEARKGALLKGQRVVSIPNTIDTRLFCPQDKQQARQSMALPTDRRIILFVSQRVTDPRKGIGYFVEAVNLLVNQHPEMKENTGVAILGGRKLQYRQSIRDLRSRLHQMDAAYRSGFAVRHRWYRSHIFLHKPGWFHRWTHRPKKQIRYRLSGSLPVRASA